MNNLTLFLQLDACRYDYIDPYISKSYALGANRRRIISPVMPTFGFEPDAAYTAGLYPDEADGGAQFWHDPENSPFRFIRTWTRAGNLLPDIPDKIVRRLIRIHAKKRVASPVLSTAKVPFHLLQYFNFPMKSRMDAETFVQSENLFDILRKNERLWLYHGPPDFRVDIQSVIQRAKRELHPPIAFAFFHVGDLDKTGHQYGPDSAQRQDAMKTVMQRVADIYQVVNERFEEVHLLIMGDHGMMEVSKHLDIWNKLKRLPVKLEKDYLVFLDSTMARFWFFSDRAERFIVDLLDNIEGGHILSQAEKDKYHLNYSHNKFGDIIFLVDPGVLIFPNFYQNRKPVRGMHGYAPETPEQQSALLIHSSKVKESKRFDEPVDMRRVFPTLLELLDLPIPEGTTAKSLLQ